VTDKSRARKLLNQLTSKLNDTVVAETAGLKSLQAGVVLLTQSSAMRIVTLPNGERFGVEVTALPTFPRKPGEDR
jgi:hypothetical protein